MKEYAIKKTTASGSVDYSPPLVNRGMMSAWVDMLNESAEGNDTAYRLVYREPANSVWVEVI